MKTLKAAAMTVGLLAVTGLAHALSFFPGRIVLDDQHRAGVLRIVNKDDEPRRYTLGWRRMRMTEEKGLRPVSEGEPATDLKPARDYLIFAPRQAVIPPGGTQAVRFLAQLPSDLPPGEYRSHLLITEPPRALGESKEGGDRIGMQIKMISRTTLPIILRHGDLDVDISVESMAIRRTAPGPRLDVVLGRRGDRSIYVNVRAVWEAPDGQRHEVFGPGTVAMYTDINRRELSHRLALPEGKKFKGGTLHYRVEERPGTGSDTGVVLAELSIDVP